MKAYSYNTWKNFDIMPPKLSKNEMEQIAQATVNLLEPKFERLEKLVADCAKTTEINKLKSSVLSNLYKIDNVDQYQRRENLQFGNFSPTGDVTNAVVELVNHMMKLPSSEERDRTTSHRDRHCWRVLLQMYRRRWSTSPGVT